MQKVGAIILAAGKGTRMNSTALNKVTLSIGNKPMILHTVELLEKIPTSPIVVVIGFAKESVVEALKGKNVVFAQQDEQLGVAHAVGCGVEKISDEIKAVVVVNGDDSAFYPEKLLQDLIQRHLNNSPVMTLLTLKHTNPKGLGRVVRDAKGEIVKIVEEKDATEEEKEITEIFTGCFVFDVKFLKTYLPKIPKSEITGEYYITRIVDLAQSDG